MCETPRRAPKRSGLDETPPKRSRSKPPEPEPYSPEPARTLDEYQAKAADVAARANLFVTGEAGSGKSFLLEHLRDTLPERHVCVAAPTWKAASRICGTSIHYFTGVNVGQLEKSAEAALNFIKARRDGGREPLARIRACEVLILDEVSMLHPYVLDNLEELCRLVRESKEPLGGIRCIFSGDFLQIPPVAKVREGPTRYAFDAKCWRRLFPTPEQNRTLRGVHRQAADPEYYRFLRRLRYGYLGVERRESGGYACEDLRLLLGMAARDDGRECLQIYATNREVDAVNQARLSQLDGDAVEYCAKDFFLEGHQTKEVMDALDEQCPRVLALKVGAPVRLTHVRNGPSLHGGMGGEVVDFICLEDGDLPLPLVELTSGQKLVVEPSVGASFSADARGPRLATRRQLPLALGWATTLHKAQGMTLQSAAVHVSHVFEKNMGYVALSRVSESKGVRLLDRFDTMTADNLRAWVRRKLCSVDDKALALHLKTLSPEDRREIEAGQDLFKKVIANDAAWAQVLCRAGFVEGSGFEQDDCRPDWAVREYGDECFRCGRRGHWMSDCMNA